MVLQDQTSKSNNKMISKNIPHPSSIRFDEDDQPPKKRLKAKREDSIETTNSSPYETEHEFKKRKSIANSTTIPDSEAEDDTDVDAGQSAYRPTELESTLPQVDTDKNAIAKYESFQFDEEIPEDLKVRLNRRTWAKGKSSIYVDAFNLALGTVLEDEGHLFDEKENEVFQQWQGLDYEAQYLYDYHPFASAHFLLI